MSRRPTFEQVQQRRRARMRRASQRADQIRLADWFRFRLSMPRGEDGLAVGFDSGMTGSSAFKGRGA